MSSYYYMCRRTTICVVIPLHMWHEVSDVRCWWRWGPPASSLLCSTRFTTPLAGGPPVLDLQQLLSSVRGRVFVCVLSWHEGIDADNNIYMYAYVHM